MKKSRYPHRMFLRSRKAQVQETQLNWIFILIVGALIMAFFVFIVIRQKASSEAKFAGKVTQQLNTILVGAKVSSGTVQIIPTPDLEIRFSCNDYYIGPASQRLGNRVVFAPEFIEGDELITWALDWSVPFKVSTFLYMTTPFVKYVVVGEGKGAEALYAALPDKLNRINMSYSDYTAGKLVNENDRHVRVMFVDPSSDTPPLPSGFDPEELSGLVVSMSSSPATVKFLDAESGGFVPQSADEFVCLEDEILFGAVFSDNDDIYKCLLRRSYERLNIVASVLKERLNHIAPAYAYHASCEGMYRENVNLKEIIDATASYPPDYATLGDAKEALKEANTRLQLRSCTLIY